MQLTIKSISDADEGDYYCHAENAFGNKTQPVSVRIRNVVSIISNSLNIKYILSNDMYINKLSIYLK
jgi:hypothetical protein